jgi:glyoxylase-like metal-dependent hydrolase (beta-lactamase superfamily II)
MTASGVILIDSGASAHSAALLEKAVKEVTPKPIRWVLNTGAQDHRWLGNDYFAKKGAEIHAMAGTVRTQQAMAGQQMDGLKRFVGPQLEGTQSNVRKAQAAFKRLVALGSKHVVPGHGRVTDLAQAKRDTGDYYDFQSQ